ncbi:MAG: paraquat-inducible protein A [Magnetococcales bacterium]|nr:paraquat-inducible protein A [Magnetococcales bacterium]
MALRSSCRLSEAVREEEHWLACPECDLLHRPPLLAAGEEACCRRCGGVLARHRPDHLKRCLSLTLAAALLFAMANVSPLLMLRLGGRETSMTLLEGALELGQHGLWDVVVLVVLTSVLFPLLHFSALLYVLLPLSFGHCVPGAALWFRAAELFSPWGMIGVYMLGVMVAVVKLADLATVTPGIATYALGGLVFCSTAAGHALDGADVWRRIGVMTLHESRCKAGLIRCHACGLVTRAPEKHPCPRCRAPLHRRKPRSLQRTWTLTLAAAILYVPANLYPIMTVTRLGQGEPNTILSGVIALIEEDMWPLAMIVFMASVVVPLGKIMILIYLLVSVQRGHDGRFKERMILYRLMETFGHWSMVDIFLVTILASLVKMGTLATIEPEIGVSFFGAVVILTLFAARAFDPRLIWDRADDHDRG